MIRSLASRVRRRLGRWKRRLSSSAIVLLYHRVADLNLDPQWLAVAPTRFDLQMRALARRHEVLSMPELRRRLAEGGLPRRSVAITFDDGYADNALAAAPILQRHGLPATIFVASGFVDSAAEWFWDDLERMLLHPGGRAGELIVAGDRYVLPPLDAPLPADWTVLQPAPSQRCEAYVRLCARVAAMLEPQRLETLDQVRRWAGTTADARESHRGMSSAHLRQCAGVPTLSIGAHTVTHPRLACLPPDRQEWELAESRRRLQEISATPVEGFSYPFGQPDDYGHQAPRLARRAGFDFACENNGGAARPGCDLFRLPRVLARNWAPEELLQRIEEAFHE